MAKRGRQPGTLVRAKCSLCGTVELATGCGGKWRCSGCREARLRHPSLRAVWWDKDECIAQVKLAIADGVLPHPRGMRCTDCGGEAVEYEHRDYNKPLCVEPICRRCNQLRGPAIPQKGAVSGAVAAGFVPYRRRLSAERIFAALSIPADTLAGLPKTLSLDHWRVLAPLVEAAQASPSLPLSIQSL